MVRWKIILEILMLTTLLGGVAGAAPADRNVTVNGLNIHYLDWGSAGKPPLILSTASRAPPARSITSRRFSRRTITCSPSICAATAIPRGTRRALSSQVT